MSHPTHAEAISARSLLTAHDWNDLKPSQAHVGTPRQYRSKGYQLQHALSSFHSRIDPSRAQMVCGFWLCFVPARDRLWVAF